MTQEGKFWGSHLTIHQSITQDMSQVLAEMALDHKLTMSQVFKHIVKRDEEYCRKYKEMEKDGRFR